MISHSHNFIFVWVMKTGGTSIEHALKKCDLEKYGIPGRRNKDATRPIKHKRALELVQIPEYADHWHGYFKFGFIRNPWDLLVSWYKHDNHGHPTFREYVLQRGWYDNKYTFTGCFDRLHDESGRCMVDLVGRFEDIRTDFSRICEDIGVKANLPHKNKTRHRHYRKYFDKEMVDIVAESFARDIDHFGYTF